MRLGAALIAVTLAAVRALASEDATDLVKRFIEAQKRTEALAKQYTYLEETDRFRYDEKGRAKKFASETHEIVFIEGLEYRKLVGRNGKPLSAREAARVEKEMLETATERRKHGRFAAPGGRIFSGRHSADLGSREELLTMFESRITGEETLGGRRTLIVESAARTDFAPRSQHEKDVTSYRKKFWIDAAEGVALRQVFTIVGDNVFAKPGSTLRMEFDEVGPATWHPNLIVLESYREDGRKLRPWLRTEYRMSGFRKFDVQSTMTVQ